METEGVRVGGEWESTGLVQVGGGREGIEEAQGVLCVLGVWLGGG